MIKDGVTSQAMITLSSGVFLTAFALALGASNTVIGLLAAIPFLAQLLQVPVIYLVEKVRDRKFITLCSATSSRFMLPLIALIPVFFIGQLAVKVLIVGLTLHSLLGAVGNCSWNSWMRDLIPEKRLGELFSKRLAWAIGLSVILSLGAGFLIERSRLLFPGQEILAYSFLFFTAFACGMLGLYFISLIPEPKMKVLDINFKTILVRPWLDLNFRNLIIFLGIWNFSINLVIPFFTVYLLNSLKLNMLVVTLLTIMSQLMNVWTFHLWGRYSDRFSNRSVLAVCSPLFMGCIFAWIFVMFPAKYLLTIPLVILLYLLMGIAMSGILLATGNIALRLAPKGEATAYLSTCSIVNSFASGFAPILGGMCIDLFTRTNFQGVISISNTSLGDLGHRIVFTPFGVLCLIAFFIGLYAVHRLAFVKEEGTVHEKVILKEFMAEAGREIHGFTVNGLSTILTLPWKPARKLWRIFLRG